MLVPPTSTTRVFGDLEVVTGLIHTSWKIYEYVRQTGIQAHHLKHSPETYRRKGRLENLSPK